MGPSVDESCVRTPSRPPSSLFGNEFAQLVTHPIGDTPTVAVRISVDFRQSAVRDTSCKLAAGRSASPWRGSLQFRNLGFAVLAIETALRGIGAEPFCPYFPARRIAFRPTAATTQRRPQTALSVLDCGCSPSLARTVTASRSDEQSLPLVRHGQSGCRRWAVRRHPIPRGGLRWADHLASPASSGHEHCPGRRPTPATFAPRPRPK